MLAHRLECGGRLGYPCSIGVDVSDKARGHRPFCREVGSTAGRRLEMVKETRRTCAQMTIVRFFSSRRQRGTKIKNLVQTPPSQGDAERYGNEKQMEEPTLFYSQGIETRRETTTHWQST